MTMVVDASVLACALLPDESDAIADFAFERLRFDPGIVPAHWWFEIRNILIVAERRSRLTMTKTEHLLKMLARLPISIRTDVDETAVFRLARAHRLTVYDAGYLELAQRAAVPLATLDRALVAAAKAEKVPLVGITV